MIPCSSRYVKLTRIREHWVVGISYLIAIMEGLPVCEGSEVARRCPMKSRPVLGSCSAFVRPQRAR